LINASAERLRFHEIVSRTIERTWLRFEEVRVEFKRLQRLAEEAEAAGQEYAAPIWPRPAPPPPSEIEGLIQQIKTEKSALLRKALLMDYLRLTGSVLKADPEWMARALEEIGPDSPLWWWQMLDLWELSSRLGDAIGQTPNPEKYKDYWLQIGDNLPEERWIPGFYATSFAIAQGFENDPTPDTEGVGPLQLDKDFLAQKAMALDPDHPAVVRRVKTYFDQLEMVGQQVPGFSLPSLEDSNVFYTNENIRAKIYLIDFWATWCGPCITQFPHLHKLYEEFSPKGFEILSCSFDSSAEVVEEFRRKRWPLPWLNSIEAEKGLRESDIGRAFKLVEVPKTFLVKKDGEILAMDPNEEEMERLLIQELR
jgi:thiol-disulfide isomerase/thioredoxin